MKHAVAHLGLDLQKGDIGRYQGFQLRGHAGAILCTAVFHVLRTNRLGVDFPFTLFPLPPTVWIPRFPFFILFLFFSVSQFRFGECAKQTGNPPRAVVLIRNSVFLFPI